MSGGSELLGAVARVVQGFDNLGIEYFVGGSVAQWAAELELTDLLNRALHDAGLR
jgi:hypothetical protein